MTSKRTYRPAMSLDQALSELRAGAGTQFDPDCVTALEQHLAGARAA
jgi:HD-GYP domain-containing protein (c-di-GMP phosphodiesterase class II)